MDRISRFRATLIMLAFLLAFGLLLLAPMRSGNEERLIVSIQSAQLKPGDIEILTWLKEHGITVAMATANGLRRTEEHLGRIGIRKYFDRIICADMVEHGKPAPDIYAYACETLGLDPGETIAVEDSPNGIRSAYAAGCNVIMVPDLTEPDEDLMKMLYARVDTLTDIKDLIEI